MTPDLYPSRDFLPGSSIPTSISVSSLSGPFVHDGTSRSGVMIRAFNTYARMNPNSTFMDLVAVKVSYAELEELSKIFPGKSVMYLASWKR